MGINNSTDQTLKITAFRIKKNSDFECLVDNFNVFWPVFVYVLLSEVSFINSWSRLLSALAS